MSGQQTFTFSADWESCDARVTYQPKWKSVGSTPGTLKLSAGRAYRVVVRSDTTAGDLDAILQAISRGNIRVVRIVHGGPITSAILGKALAKLKGVESVGMSWPFDAVGWLVDIGLAPKENIRFDLENWPVDEVTAALSQIASANALRVRMDKFKDPFSLEPLFQIGGLKSFHIDHCSHSKQRLEWAGLSGQTKLRDIHVRGGFLGEDFWSELGKLRHLPEIQIHWPEKAKAKKGSLPGMAALKKLEGHCIFDYVPEAFAAFAECPGIDVVKLEQANLDDASAAGIGAMAKVKDAYIWNAELTDAGMQALCLWPRVKALVLCEKYDNPNHITEKGFQALGNLKVLETLHLQGFDKVGVKGWAVLRDLPRLKRFKVMSQPAFDLMEAIGPLPGVQQLRFSHCNSVGPAGIRQLKAMRRLRSLAYHVLRWRPYQIPLDEIGELRQLTNLLLSGLHKMTDVQLEHVASLRDLEVLYLHEANKITDVGIAALASLKKLRVVSLHTLPLLTDQTLKTLVGLPRLQTLRLRCTTKITDKGLASLAGARRLTTLHLDYARKLTGEGLLRLVRELPLEELTVYSAPHLTDDHLRELTEHPKLKRVSFGQCKNITRDGLEMIAKTRPDWKGPSFNFWQMM